MRFASGVDEPQRDMKAEAPGQSVAARRVAALRATGLLDTAPEERFDRLTRLARHLLRTPVAMVSLLDADRQFFLSAQGLPEPLVNLRQTPLAYSFCRSVVETGLPLSVRDAREDPNLRLIPAIEGFEVIAYLAVPLALPDGCVIGALCTIDLAPRQWAAQDEAILSDLASAVMSEVASGVRLREFVAATEALRESETRYRALFEISPQVVWFTDAIGRVTYGNPYYTDLVGRTAEQVEGEGWLETVHPEDRPRVLASWTDAVASGQEYQIEIRLRLGSDGSFRWHLAKGAPLRSCDGRIDRWIGVATDIDDRKRAEEALRALIEALGVAVYTTDAAGCLTFYNEAAVSFWGWRPSLNDSRWCGSWRLYEPDGTPMPHNECPMEIALRENRPLRGEAIAARPDGTRVPFIAYPAPLHDETGALTGGVNVLVDITERKDAEAALRESEARLHLALEAGRLASWELDVATGRIARSSSHDRIFGYETPLPEWDFSAFLSHVLPEDRAETRYAYKTLTESKSGAFIECRIRRAGDGEIRWIEVHGKPQLGRDGRTIRYLGVVRDITDRKRTEESLREKESRLRELHSELLHVSRLSAAGEMASALAHELNQPLTAIASAVRAAQWMVARLEGGQGPMAEIDDAMGLAAEQALRAGQIVRHLRDFVARDGEADKQIENLSKLAEEAGALALVGAKEHGVHIEFHFDPLLPPVLVDRIQIQQVLLNLMRNGLEAMLQEDVGPGQEPPRRELKVTAGIHGPDMVEVVVSDTGPGLPQDVAGRLFNAFVSTKQGGMGMGLSICRSIVGAHGGRIWVERNPGRGAVFRFTLPAATPDLAPH